MTPTMRSVFRKWIPSARHPSRQSAVEGRLRPVRISLFTEQRFDECVDLYRTNIPTVPEEGIEAFRHYLAHDDVLKFVADLDGKLVGTFGVNWRSDNYTAWLSYLLVDPAIQRAGIGTTLLLASIALFHDAWQEFALLILALPGTSDFYSRFGFSHRGRFADEDGLELTLASLPVTPGMAASCGQWLLDAGAVLPTGSFQIPVSD